MKYFAVFFMIYLIIIMIVGIYHVVKEYKNTNKEGDYD